MTDDQIRAAILKKWTAAGLLAVHCGGAGLAVGCPVCRRRFG